MLAFAALFGHLVEHVIRADHIVDNGALADFLALELGLRGEITPVVITKMVVRRNGEGLDPRIYEELDQGGLELRLSRLEIISANE